MLSWRGEAGVAVGVLVGFFREAVLCLGEVWFDCCGMRVVASDSVSGLVLAVDAPICGSPAISIDSDGLVGGSGVRSI